MTSTDELDRERRWANASFIGGSLAFVLFVAWFYGLELGFARDMDKSMADDLLATIHRNYSVRPDRELALRTVILFEVRTFIFLSFELGLLLVLSVADANAMNLRSYEIMKRKEQARILNWFVAVYGFLILVVAFSWRFMCFYETACDGENSEFGELIFYASSFVLIACAPYFISIAIRKIGYAIEAR